MEGKWIEARCTQCDEAFYRLDNGAAPMCNKCMAGIRKGEEIAREYAHITRNKASYTRKWLAKAGLSEREMQAKRDLVPAYITDALKAYPGMAQFSEGTVPQRGFGLSGSAGSGKSFAIASMFIECLHENWYRRCPTEGMKGTNLWLAWVRWPEKVNEMRVASMRDKGIETVFEGMEKLASVEALVLDDLGAERLKGEYSDDWATSQLDLLIDKRYNEMKPTWFTTNLSPQDFASRYGARMFSRLCSDNPIIRIGGQKDIRMSKRER